MHLFCGFFCLYFYVVKIQTSYLEYLVFNAMWQIYIYRIDDSVFAADFLIGSNAVFNADFLIGSDVVFAAGFCSGSDAVFVLKEKIN